MDFSPLQYVVFISLGLAVGTLGTLIGVGGGFMLVPALLLLCPKEDPEIITSISLAVVFCNATSGSMAYARMKRIDYGSGLLLAAATIPGAILGAWTTRFLERSTFDVLFGVIMLAASIFLITNPPKKNEKDNKGSENLKGFVRRITEADGTQHIYSYKPSIGATASLAEGFISSLLGIGGGILHVPVLVKLLRFPVHIATATSQFILIIMSLTASTVHLHSGALQQNIFRTVTLSLGVMVGAQIGARLSKRLHGAAIIRVLGVALASVGVKILLAAFRFF